jgi:hypothetical protein
MEDYNSNLLNDSKSEWSIRLMNILCGHVIDGFRSIFNEAIELCETNEEPEKYLMTFQNFLSRIPKWNQNMVHQECERIKETSQCAYLDDLITCVHVLQVKILSCVRTNNQVKKIDIDIPPFDNFLHNIYINIARKLYSNIYLFQVDVTPLEQQKNNREFETIVQSCIMNTIRDNIPVEQLLKQYMDETQEEGYVKEEPPKVESPPVSSTSPPSTSSMESTIPDVPVSTDSVVLPPPPPVASHDEPSNVNFNKDVEKYDPVNDETINEQINFEAKEEPTMRFDEDDYDDEAPLTIGEPVSLDLDNNVEQVGESNEIIPIELNALSLPEPKEDMIDLGVEEIKL